MKVKIKKIVKKVKDNINSDICSNCGEKTLTWTMKPNGEYGEDNDDRFGCQIFGEICTNCGYEHYEDEE